MAYEYEAARDNPERLRAFVNTALAEPWDYAGQSGTTEDTLMARREHYGPRPPQPLAIMAAGCDVQGDRTEVSVYAWSCSEESWLIEHVKLMGDPSRPMLWAELDEFLLRTWLHPVLGRCMRLASIAGTSHEKRLPSARRGAAGASSR